jgi:cysteine-rich repeat protein
MLRPIYLLVAAGLCLCACSGDSKSGQNTGGGTAQSCDVSCAADEVCSGGECLPTCSRDSQCKGGNTCRDGACHPVTCGDELVEGDEECDNGDRNRDDASCTSACLRATCGDGLLWANREECDDGPDNADDGACTSTCKLPSPPRCGDGIVWAGHEDCDDGANNADDGACTSQCVAATCGDGLVWKGHEECDDGNQKLNDACPDGPKGTCKTNLAPAPATGLGWQQGAYTNATTLVATWSASPSPNLAAQELQLFEDDSCTSASGKVVALPSTSTASQQLPVAGEGSYTFQITTRDSKGRQSTSDCSPVMVVDTTPPAAAKSLGFVEASPHDTLTVHGTWTLSASTDLGSQSLQLYGGGTCGVALGAAIEVGSASAEEYPIVTPTNGTYSFKVISADKAGNQAVSACSPAMQTSGGKPYTAKFNGDLQRSVIQVRIDPQNPSTLYATLTNGEVQKSVNGGSTWAVQCTSSNIAGYGYGRIFIGPDGTAYATGHTQFARVEALSGAECPVAFHSSAAWASYYHSNRLAIDSTGKLYTWTFTSPGGLLSSVNHGDTFSSINATPSLFNSMEVDPFDDKHLVGVFGSHDTDPVGISSSIDAGVKWTQTDATFENYQGGVRFNPAAKGWIYLGGGHYSKDGGLTWDTSAAFDCLEVATTGAGYRLVSGATGAELHKAPDMTNPAWSKLYTFTGVQADLSVSMVSVVGSSIAVVLEGRLFVSANSGGTFTPVKLSVKDAPLTASSIVAHGSLLYAAANGRVFKSSDSAKSWAEVYAPASPLDGATELYLNPGVVDQVVARPERWNSTYENRVDVTLDGGASWSNNTTDCCYGWSGVLALGAADASRLFYFGWEPRYSSNGGLSFMQSSSSGQLVWDPWPNAFVNPGNSNGAWYGDDSGRLYEYDLLAKSDANITSRLPFATPAGIDLVKVGGVWQLRIISRTGQIAISNDNGKTFAAVPGSGGLPSADRRIFVSHPDTPGLIATATLLGADVAYSPTLGASWVQTSLASCEIRSLALTDGQLLIPCDSSAAMAIAAP